MVANSRLVHGNVLRYHACHREIPLDSRSTRGPLDLGDAAEPIDQARPVGADEPHYTILDDLGCGAEGRRDDRCAASDRGEYA